MGTGFQRSNQPHLSVTTLPREFYCCCQAFVPTFVEMILLFYSTGFAGDDGHNLYFEGPSPLYIFATIFLHVVLFEDVFDFLGSLCGAQEPVYLL